MVNLVVFAVTNHGSEPNTLLSFLEKPHVICGSLANSLEKLGARGFNLY